MAGSAVNVGSGQITIYPAPVPGFAHLLQTQLNAMPNPSIQINPQVNQQGLLQLNRGLSQTSGRLDVAKSAAVGAFAALSVRGLSDKYAGVSGLSNKITEAAAAATSAASAVGPLIGLIGGLGAGFAVAGAGVGSFYALAKPQISAVTDATKAAGKAQADYATAVATGDTKGAQKALDDRNKALASLTPLQRTAALSTISLKTAFTDASNALAPQSLGIYTAGVKTLTGLLPAITPVAKAAGTALQGIFGQAQAGLKNALSDDGGLGAFLNVVTKNIGPVLTSLSGTLVNVGRTLSNVFQAAVPVMLPALNVIKELTGSLSNASGGEGLLNFFKQVTPLLEPLRQVITSITRGIGTLIQAAVPLAGPLLTAIKAITDALGSLFSSQAFGQFVTNLMSAVTSLTPLFAQLVGPIGQVLDVISGQVANLIPILIPIVVQFANVFSNVLVGLSPLLPLFAQLIGILIGFLPVLYPIITAFRAAMVPILKAVGQALQAVMPAVTALVQAFTPLLPVVGELFSVVAPLVAALLQGMAPAVVVLLNALKPLIPIITEIVAEVGGTLAQAFALVMQAIRPLIPVLANMAGRILGALLHAFVQMEPAILQIVSAALKLLPVFLTLLPVYVQLANVVLPVLVVVMQALAPIISLVANLLAAIGPTVLYLVAAFRTFALVMAVVNLVMAANPFVLIGIAIAAFVIGVVALYQHCQVLRNVIEVVWKAIQIAINFAWNNVLKPILGALKDAWTGLTVAFRWYWDNYAHPVLSAFGATVDWLWKNVLKPTFGAISSAWNGLGTGMKWVLDNLISPIWGAISSALGAVSKAFDWVTGAIKTTWDKLAGIFKAPINITLGVVKTFDHVVNDILGAVGIKARLPEKNLHLATGGVIPGNHTRDDVPFFGTPGEGVLSLPGMARLGGMLGMAPTAALGTLNGGGSSDGRHYAAGGVLAQGTVPKSNILGDIGGAVSGAAGSVFNAGKWVLDEASHLLRAGAANALQATLNATINPLLSLLGSTVPGQLALGGAKTVEKALVGFIRGKEGSLSGTYVGSGSAAGTGGPLKGIGDFGGGGVGTYDYNNIIAIARANGWNFSSALPGDVGNLGGAGGGNSSFHETGNAVDFSGGADMGAFSQWVFDHFGKWTLELIHNPFAHNIKNGNDVSDGYGLYGAATMNEHFNHVHWAITDDELHSALYGAAPKVGVHGTGGIASGWSLLGDMGPELVHAGSSSRVLSSADSIAALMRSSGVGKQLDALTSGAQRQNTGPLVNVENFHAEGRSDVNQLADRLEWQMRVKNAFSE